jgi:hypothetical protein
MQRTLPNRLLVRQTAVNCNGESLVFVFDSLPYTSRTYDENRAVMNKRVDMCQRFLAVVARMRQIDVHVAPLCCPKGEGFFDTVLSSLLCVACLCHNDAKIKHLSGAFLASENHMSKGRLFGNERCNSSSPLFRAP